MMLRRMILPLSLAIALLPALAGQSQETAQTGTEQDDRGSARGRAEGGRATLEAAVARVRPLLERYGYPAVFVAVGVEGMLHPRARPDPADRRPRSTPCTAG